MLNKLKTLGSAMEVGMGLGLAGGIAIYWAILRFGAPWLLLIYVLALSVLYVRRSCRDAFFSITVFMLVLILNYGYPLNSPVNAWSYLNLMFWRGVSGVHPHFKGSTTSLIKLYDWVLFLAAVAGAYRLLKKRSQAAAPVKAARTTDGWMRHIALIASVAYIVYFTLILALRFHIPAMMRWKNFVEPVAALLIFYPAFQDDRHLPRFRRFLLFWAFLLALMQTVNLLRASEGIYNMILTKSVYNTLGASNTIAGMYMLAGLMTLPMVKGSRNVFFWLEWVLIAVSAFFTLSRGGVLAAGASLCIYFVLFKRDQYLLLRLAATVAGTAAVMMLMTLVVWGTVNPAASQSVVERVILLDEMFAGFEPDGSAAWRAVLDTPAMRWILGNGLAYAGKGILLHNDFLQAIAEAGIIGLILYLSLLGSIGVRSLWGAYRNPRQPYYMAMMVGTCALAAHSLVEPIFSVERIFIIFMVIASVGMFPVTEPGNPLRRPGL